MGRMGVLTAAVCFACLAAPTNAGLVTEGAFSGSETVIDFSSLVSSPAVGPFTLSGVTFSQFHGNPMRWKLLDTAVPNFSGNFLADGRSISQYRLEFPTPQSRAGLWVGLGPATYQVTIFDASLTPLESTTVAIPSGHTAAFAGFENSAGIARLEVSEISGVNGYLGGIDTVRFESFPIPEPTTLALFGLGLVGLVAWRRKRRKAG